MMIANVVTGRAAPNADESIIRERLVPAFQQMPGYQGGYWLRQADGDQVITVTLWESEEALRSALSNPTVREVTSQTAAMLVGGPQMGAYRLVAQG